ncbi:MULTISPECIES: 23S rRNA (adenine(1618)-N(6))-methyltransferase RlmF [unclassified Pedobacter]|uniref:23S rRNA (adenine(1618)-N(6))-methyltransferase RlmF n=1 Tax=Pedobacter TaxID=84567 RepID=UPI000B4A6665|nr:MULTISPECIES: 23S rRNA (adenine(1618)-N(6))-methyltransferase RlmF [unclassified Pedobacter]MCX2432521.1 23S rRNA (adenine(1618)-N(6))-methyltransferase RlmF [Pedobacter sp. GR22-10]OWK72083.1 23S rRNA (adenine(1618)-N(6))-methyltransferase [Pedobacter sp. AJM]
MAQEEQNNRKEKSELHPRNKHRSRYNFKQLISTSKELKRFVFKNEHHDDSIDFADQNAVKALNRALLKYFYNISQWDIPQDFLCPPIPGRADYIHYVADLLGSSNKGKNPKGANVHVLDIGVGANCIYPIIGHQEYGWNFVGSEIDPLSVDSAKRIIEANKELQGAIEIRQQSSKMGIFRGIVGRTERFDAVVCNPPFHASLKEAEQGTRQKWRNLGGNEKEVKHVLNFGGNKAELWCPGGERAFVEQMIIQSAQIKKQVLWFTSLVSKSANLKSIYGALVKAEAFEVRTVQMSQGQKISRFVAWTFQDDHEQAEWAKGWK